MSNSKALPISWALSTLEEVAISAGGGTPSKDDPRYWENGTIPWISPKDMKSFILQSSQDQVTESALEHLTLVPKNSVLAVVRSGILSHTFPVALNTEAGTINQDMRAFIPEAGVSARYLAWQLVASGSDILRKCSKHGTTVASIEGVALARFPLTIAPTAEQTRIVEKLEELLSDLDAGVAELKAAQKKLTQYRQSLLKAAVEGELTAEWRKHNPPQETGAQLLDRILKERRARWEAKQLAKFAEQGKAPPKGWQDKYVEPVRPDTSDLPELPEEWVWASLDQLSSMVRNGLSQKPSTDPIGYPILRINAVRPLSVNLNEVRYLSLNSTEVADYLLEEGDLLVTRYNGSVDLLGVAGVVRGLNVPTVHPDKLIRIKPVLKSTLADWIEICAAIGESRKHVVSRVKTTAGQTGISGEDVKKMPIPLAPFYEQSMAIEIVGNTMQEIIEQDKAINLLLTKSAAQRKNILKAAFSGQLAPQDPNDEPASVLLERIRAERVSAVKTSGKKARHA